MLWGWMWIAATHGRLRSKRREVVIIGTDPIFGILATIPWRILRPRVRIIHWCHDVHPEATLADGTSSLFARAISVLSRVLRVAYRRCDVVVDLGSCMRKLLLVAGGWDRRTSPAPQFETITPWALAEPNEVKDASQDVRLKLFGECQLALLYSGNLGRAHDISTILRLARLSVNDSINFCFAGEVGVCFTRSRINFGRLECIHSRFCK